MLVSQQWYGRTVRAARKILPFKVCMHSDRNGLPSHFLHRGADRASPLWALGDLGMVVRKEHRGQKLDLEKEDFIWAHTWLGRLRRPSRTKGNHKTRSVCGAIASQCQFHLNRKRLTYVHLPTHQITSKSLHYRPLHPNMYFLQQKVLTNVYGH